MIILDNIYVQKINEFINEDFSFNKKYVTSLKDCSNIGKYILTHIKINRNSESQFYDHITFYQNILKINTSYTERLKEGEEIRLFPKIDEEIKIYFDYPYNDFNYEIKFLGRADSSEYNITITDCEGIIKILYYNNKIIRGNCKNINYNTKITLINNKKTLTGIIIKRAFSKNIIKNLIVDSLGSELNIGKDLTVIKYDKNLTNLFYFYNKITLKSDIYPICLYQDYSDINYLSYPSKYSCFNRIENFSSYENLSADYNLIYNDNNAKGKFINSDYLYLIINSNKLYTYINFQKIFKINANNMESEDIDSLNDYNGYFYIMPKKTNIYNYDSLFIQLFEKNSDSIEFKLYKNLELFFTFLCSSYGNYHIEEINTDNQLMLYIEHKNNFTFRYKLYNSKTSEYTNYNYKTNLITTNTFLFQILDKTNLSYKYEIKPYPHEINGCSNYYFFILKPNTEIDNINYYNFKRLNSSVFSGNITIENICSVNGEFDSKDLEKFIFNSTIKVDKNITVFGYSEQIDHFKAIKFYPISEFYDYYEEKQKQKQKEKEEEEKKEKEKEEKKEEEKKEEEGKEEEKEKEIKKSKSEMIIIIVSCSVGFIIMVILIFILLKRRKSNRQTGGSTIINNIYPNNLNNNEMLIMNEYDNNPNVPPTNNSINNEENNLPDFNEILDQSQSENN